MGVRNLFKGARGWLGSLNNRPLSPFEVSVDDTDVHLVHDAKPEKTAHMTWSEISHVYAYKQDCFAIDDIRLILVDGQKSITVSESDRGFSLLVTALTEKLRGFPKDWFDDIAQPPFKTNLTQLYPEYKSLD